MKNNGNIALFADARLTKQIKRYDTISNISFFSFWGLRSIGYADNFVVRTSTPCNAKPICRIFFFSSRFFPYAFANTCWRSGKRKS